MKNKGTMLKKLKRKREHSEIDFLKASEPLIIEVAETRAAALKFRFQKY